MRHRSKLKKSLRRGAVAVTVVLAVAIAGCGSSTGTNPGADATSSSVARSLSGTSSPITTIPTVRTSDTASSTVSSPVIPTPRADQTGDAASSKTATASTAIVLEIGGQQINGDLDNSATSASLVAQLPLTLSFSDYGGQEKAADLPHTLDLTDAPEGSDAPPLTIGYYVPDQRLILYYDHVDYFKGIVPIGRFTDVRAVRSQPDNFPVTIRRVG